MLKLLTNIFFSQSLVTGLQEVDKLKAQVHDIQVPTEVFE